MKERLKNESFFIKNVKCAYYEWCNEEDCFVFNDSLVAGEDDKLEIRIIAEKKIKEIREKIRKEMGDKIDNFDILDKAPPEIDN